MLEKRINEINIKDYKKIINGSEYYIKTKVKKVDIFIFKSHEYALLPWSNVMNNDYSLVTIDYHSDLHNPFQFTNYFFKKSNLKNKTNYIDRDVNSISFSSEGSFIQSIINNLNYEGLKIGGLRNDEQIKAALKLNIFKDVYVYSRDFIPSEDIIPTIYEKHVENNNGLYEVSKRIKKEINSDCVLDIDLDFILCKSFIKMVKLKNVKQITIALEPKWFDDAKDDKINCEDYSHCREKCKYLTIDNEIKKCNYSNYQCLKKILKYLKRKIK